MKTSGFLRGAVLGLIAGLLVAPRSGKETRENIKKHYEEILRTDLGGAVPLEDITKETYAQVVGTVVDGFVETKEGHVRRSRRTQGRAEEGL